MKILKGYNEFDKVVLDIGLCDDVRGIWRQVDHL